MTTSYQTIRKTAATGRGGAVSAARLPTVQAGMDMLDMGGNAVDAAVAAGFVAGVIEPMETTLAGSGFMLVHVPGEAVHSVEFAPRAPLAASRDMYRIDERPGQDRGLGISSVIGDENLRGIRAAGVPATLMGLVDAHHRFGTLPLATVLAPAIRLAHDGFPADSYYTLEVVANLAALRADPGANAAFLDNGDPAAAAHLGETTLGAPHMVRQAALGRTLELLAAQGADAVRRNAIGAALIETVRDLGGLIAAEDLHAAQTRIGPARRLRFRDADVWGPTAPSGTITQHQMLNIWSALHPNGGPQDDTPRRLQDFAAASWHAFADRYHWLGDPDIVPVPEAGLLSDAYAHTLAAQIAQGQPAPRSHPGDAPPWEKFAGHAAHDPWAFQADGPRPNWTATGATEPTAGTTHVSVIDGNGMAVSLTHTAANHFGSKVVCPRTGLLFDNAMGWFNARPNAANSIAGGKRPLANMAPMMLTSGGEVTAALGAPGGRRIISAVVQIALNLIERGMPVEDAVHAPRIDASGADILMSERLAPDAASWDAGAFPWRPVQEQFMPFDYEMARPVVVTRAPDGQLHAVTDPGTKGYSRAM